MDRIDELIKEVEQLSREVKELRKNQNWRIDPTHTAPPKPPWNTNGAGLDCRMANIKLDCRRMKDIREI